MRLLPVIFLCLLLAAPAGHTVRAQEFVPTPVTVSSEKVNIEGRIFYMHKVLKGQTLYSISKAYGVSEEDIQTANPALKDGLKAGMLLYIPVQTAVAEAVTATPSQKPDTLSASDKSSLETERKEATKTKKKKYRRYYVRWYETLDDVAVKFNVTKEAIISLNDIDPESGKRVKTIFIPDEEYMREMGLEPAACPDGMEATAQKEETEAVYEPDNIFAARKDAGYYNDGTYRITLILPFNASKMTDNTNAYAADFYAGALTAVYDLKEQGMFDHFVLNTVDLSAYSGAWEMVASGILDDSELIIGPISERDLQPVASYARSKGIPVVSPLDLKTASLAQDNPCLYLFPPQTELALPHQIQKIASKEDVAAAVIYEQGYENSDIVTSTFAELQKQGVPYRTFSYDFLSGRGIDASLRRQLDTARLNCVIIPSMSEAFITDALRNLNLIKSSGKYRIEVYGFSRWKSFETIELDYFHALDVRLAMSYHIDYNQPATKAFIAEYREIFNTDPTSFSFQGYDIMTFFVTAMYDHGKNFPQAIINERKSLLQSDVLFLPIGKGSGYENQAFKDICFTKGWEIREE